jgi:hypothetical protein
MKRFDDARVAAVFKALPPAERARLAGLREMILDVAKATPGVGAITETLKWGQPSYLTEETGAGSTVRIDKLKSGDGCAVYFHCQSGLVSQFRELYPDKLTFEGERAILLKGKSRVPERELRHCIALALTHHLRKKNRNRE